jgi:hypothetical protein
VGDARTGAHATITTLNDPRAVDAFDAIELDGGCG